MVILGIILFIPLGIILLFLYCSLVIAKKCDKYK